MKQQLESLQADIARYRTSSKPVTLVAVTKYASLKQMEQLYELGVRDFGENKVQDTLAKMSALPKTLVQNVRWHLIGHLQQNKVNKAVGLFGLIHSVDSLELAEKISKRAGQLTIRQDILLQVNISGETSKTGFEKQALENSFEAIIGLPNLKIQGLMTIAPAHASDTELNHIFQGLKELQNQLSQSYAEALDRHAFCELSMGMSQDYVHALKNGATIIRIGQYLLQDLSV